MIALTRRRAVPDAELSSLRVDQVLIGSRAQAARMDQSQANGTSMLPELDWRAEP